MFGSQVRDSPMVSLYLYNLLLSVRLYRAHARHIVIIAAGEGDSEDLSASIHFIVLRVLPKIGNGVYGVRIRQVDESWAWPLLLFWYVAIASFLAIDNRLFPMCESNDLCATAIFKA